MSNNQCIECGAKKKLFSFNYAGFDVKAGNFHRFPDRIQAPSFPGKKEDDFLCGNCADKRVVTCSAHGQLNDNFALGVPPRCCKCTEEESANVRDAKIQSFWARAYPAAESNMMFKVLYTRGGLAFYMLDTDGSIEESEETALNNLPERVSGRTEYEYEAFASGFNACKDKKVGLAQLLENCSQLKDAEANKNTIRMLLHIASANGCLDKGEYNLIKKVAQGLDIVAPAFEVLATKLNLTTSNNTRDEAIAIAKNIGLGALVLGGAALKLMLESELQAASTTDQENQTKSKPKEHEIRGHRKCCGTCLHWGGPRMASSNRRDVLFEDDNVRGVCVINRINKPQYSSCSTWQRWNILK